MKVLIACEFSGIVRDAFAVRGHDAWSCDLLPTERPGQHIHGNVLDILSDGWDMMIAHPPCTHLSSSGAKWFAAKRADGRQRVAIDFFMAMAKAEVDRIAVENPVGIMSSVYRKPDQIIQPWQFGHSETKATCLWLKGLPPLTPTKIVGPPPSDKDQRRSWERLHRLPPGPDRWKIRSRTYKGIADAMADQWGIVEPEEAGNGE